MFNIAMWPLKADAFIDLNFARNPSSSGIGGDDKVSAQFAQRTPVRNPKKSGPLSKALSPMWGLGGMDVRAVGSA